jgi:hypothetical protein
MKKKHRRNGNARSTYQAKRCRVRLLRQKVMACIKSPRVELSFCLQASPEASPDSVCSSRRQSGAYDGSDFALATRVRPCLSELNMKNVSNPKCPVLE